MSWIKSLSFNGEDVFDEDANDLSLAGKEWKSNMKKRVKDGYVDGIDCAKESSLQDGFNIGYREGAKKTVAVGRLKGILRMVLSLFFVLALSLCSVQCCQRIMQAKQADSAIQCWYQFQHPETPAPAAVTELLQRVEKHEAFIAEGMRKTYESPPPSVSDVAENMQTLEVEGESACCKGEGGCGAVDCCKQDNENMDLEFPEKPQTTYSGCSHSGEIMWEQLLQRCMDVVVELGLPQELIQHLQTLKCLENVTEN